MIGIRGGDLLPKDCATLAERWIDKPTAEAAFLRRVDEYEAREILGRDGGGRYEGIAIPEVWPGTDRVREFSIRRDYPEIEKGKPKQKYMRPPGRGNMLYFPPGVDPTLLTDASCALVLTEGPLKALALYRLSRHGRESSLGRFLPAALPGVWNFRGVIGKKLASDGTRVDEKGAISDLARVQWQGRMVIIVFDADATTNDSVRAARATLTRELQSRGALVRWFQWPTDLPVGVKGIDDLLAAAGPDVVLRLLDSAPEQKTRRQEAGWRKSLIVNEVGSPKAILANAIAALLDAPEWRGVLWLNTFSFHTVARKETPWGFSGPWKDEQDMFAAEWLQREGVFVNVEVTRQAVEAVAHKNCFHPVRDYLCALKWDAHPRLDTWLVQYFGAEDSAYVRSIGAKWMIAAVVRIHRPGVKSDHVLILEGSQGLGKSTALAVLGGPFFVDEISDLGTKDAALQAQGAWIVELSELDAMGRAEIAKVKSFISRTTDRFRPPYGRRVIELPRQCVFAGTVNHSSYLRDETGGRRFWPVSCFQINLDALRRDRDQLWAEAQSRYAAGEKWWLDGDVLAAAETEQRERYESDAWEEPILAWSEGRESVSIPEILESALEKPKSLWAQTDMNRIARILRAHHWEKHRRRDGKSLSWAYRRREQ
jgi:predicted P-loop ATPase